MMDYSLAREVQRVRTTGYLFIKTAEIGKSLWVALLIAEADNILALLDEIISPSRDGQDNSFFKSPAS
jgi:hypothetical protein